MIYFDRGQYYMSTHTISYYDKDIGNVKDKFVGVEGINWWKNFEKQWREELEFKITKITELELDDSQIKRLKEVNSIMSSETLYAEEYIKTGNLDNIVLGNPLYVIKQNIYIKSLEKENEELQFELSNATMETMILLQMQQQSLQEEMSVMMLELMQLIQLQGGN